MLNDDLITHLI